MFKEENGVGVNFTKVKVRIWEIRKDIPQTPQGLRMLLRCSSRFDKIYLLDESIRVKANSARYFGYKEKKEVITFFNAEYYDLYLVHKFIGKDDAGNVIEVMETTPKKWK